jgi:hypothetical protein
MIGNTRSIRHKQSTGRVVRPHAFRLVCLVDMRGIREFGERSEGQRGLMRGL